MGAIFLVVNIEQALRVIANFYLKQYQSELQLQVTSLEIDKLDSDVIQLGELSFKQANHQLRFAHLQLQLDTEKPYWLSRLVLEKGLLLLDSDSVRQWLSAQDNTSRTDSLALYQELVALLERLPEIIIKEFTGEITSRREKVADTLSLVDTQLGGTADTKASVNLKINRQDLVSLQTDFQPEVIAGSLTADLGKLNALLERYLEQPLMVTGKLSSDFSLAPSAAGWSLTSTNKVTNSQLDLSGITGETANFLFDGDFSLNYLDEALTVKATPGVTITPDADTVKGFRVKLKKGKFHQELEFFLLENIPQQLLVSSGSEITLDMSQQRLFGNVQLLSQIKHGELALKVPKFEISEQEQSATWQFDYQQQQPIKQLGRGELNLSGEMLHSPLTSKTYSKGGSVIVRTVKARKTHGGTRDY